MNLTLKELSNMKWNVINILQNETRLDVTLNCGQSFRWQAFGLGGCQWIGVMNGLVWILQQDQSSIMYKVLGQPNKHSSSNKRASKKLKIDESSNYEKLIKDYLQLDYQLQGMCEQWCKTDENFFKLASKLQGVRILRQDPVETLFSFICSSNNNISRITSMVENLCRHYGEKIVEIEGESFYSFPTLDKLAGSSVCEHLKQLGFGYRAKFICETAKYLRDKCPSDFLFELRKRPYEEAKEELMKLPGVGAKVADCVCLMSLDKLEAVPVDTHVRQIAERDYKLKITTKSLTDSSYNKIANFFRTLWGPYAGWAQSIAFSAELKKFQPLMSKNENTSNPK